MNLGLHKDAPPNTPGPPWLRWLPWLWLLMMLTLAVSGWRVLPHVTLSESSLLKLLPDAQLDAPQRRILEQVSTQSGQTSLWLLETTGTPIDDVSIALLREQLQASGLFGSIGVDTTGFRRLATDLFPWRYHLLGPEIRRLLATDPDQLTTNRLRDLFAPGGMARATNLQDDPLDLFAGWLMGLARDESLLRNGAIMVNDHIVILPATLHGSGFDLETQFALATLMETLDTRFADTSITLRVGGIPAYAAWNAVSARSEMSIVGTGSILGVVLLLLLTFRSLRPLGYALLVIGSGVLAGAIVSLLLFDRVHMLTWVFGASLIGISIDYPMHLLASAQGRAQGRSQEHAMWTPALGINRILGPTAIGVASSALGFVALLFTPFPVLREIATFAITGLLMAWFSCIALAGVLLNGYAAVDRNPVMRIATRLADWRDQLMRRRWPVYGVVAAIAVPGLVWLTPNDDISALQAVDTPVALDDAYIREHLPLGIAGQFFLIEGASESDVITREARLADKIRASGVANPLALSDLYVLPDEQHKGIDLLQQALGTSGRADSLFARIGYSPAQAQAEYERWNNAADVSLPLETFTRSLPPPWSLLWQGCTDGTCRSIVLLEHIKDRTALSTFASGDSAGADPGVRLIDQVALLSGQFAGFRTEATRMLVIGLVLILGVLTLAYGWRAALRITLVPCLGVAIALGMLGLSGTLYSVFNLFALLLVFGIGIDYAVFQHVVTLESTRADTNDPVRGRDHDRERTELAILLSAITTLLAFGLLAVSQTTVIAAFGSTLTAGIATCWLLAPLARAPERSTRS